jgi:hypothetical protein
VEHFRPGILIRTLGDVEQQTVVIDLNMGAAWPLDDPEPETGTPDIVGLARNHLSLRLADGVLQLLLLLLDPRQALDNGEPDSFLVEPTWRGHPDTADGRVDADVQVLDVLVYDVDINA